MVSLHSVSLVVLSLTQSYQCLGDIKYHWILMSPEFPRFSMEMFTPPWIWFGSFALSQAFGSFKKFFLPISRD